MLRWNTLQTELLNKQATELRRGNTTLAYILNTVMYEVETIRRSRTNNNRQCLNDVTSKMVWDSVETQIAHSHNKYNNALLSEIYGYLVERV